MFRRQRRLISQIDITHMKYRIFCIHILFPLLHTERMHLVKILTVSTQSVNFNQQTSWGGNDSLRGNSTPTRGIE